MKKFIFNSPPTNTGQVSPYFKDKTAFEDFIVVDNYLVMRESTNTLSIFKISKEKISAEFFKKITLSNKNQIKAMDAINPKNLFIIFHNKEVCVKYSFNAYGPQNVDIDDNSYSTGSTSYGSGIREYPGEPDGLKTPTWYTKYINQSNKLKLNVTSSSENLNLIKSYFDFKSLADSIALSENIHSFTETNNFLAENGKIIHDRATNKNYRVKINQ